MSEKDERYKIYPNGTICERSWHGKRGEARYEITLEVSSDTTLEWVRNALNAWYAHKLAVEGSDE